MRLLHRQEMNLRLHRRSPWLWRLLLLLLLLWLCVHHERIEQHLKGVHRLRLRRRRQWLSQLSLRPLLPLHHECEGVLSERRQQLLRLWIVGMRDRRSGGSGSSGRRCRRSTWGRSSSGGSGSGGSSIRLRLL